MTATEIVQRNKEYADMINEKMRQLFNRAAEDIMRIILERIGTLE